MPEGMAIAAPLYAATQHRGKSIAAAFVSGMSEPLGALAATLSLQPVFVAWPWLVSCTFCRARMRGTNAQEDLLCVVAGIMTGVSFLELLPEAQVQSHKDRLLVSAGFVTGSVVMLATIMIV